jgi:hypothetical protein
MKPLKLPPRIKILEALGCIADGRVTILNENHAIVRSSEGTRSYKVYIDLNNNIVYSDDNGTKIKGYMGYPIIALLMIKGVVPFNEEIAKALSKIPWRELNEKYKNYYIVEKIVKNIALKRGVDIDKIDRFIEMVINALRGLSLYYDENIKTISNNN